MDPRFRRRLSAVIVMTGAALAALNTLQPAVAGVTHVLGKLGFRTRSQITAWVAEQRVASERRVR